MLLLSFNSKISGHELNIVSCFLFPQDTFNNNNNNTTTPIISMTTVPEIQGILLKTPYPLDRGLDSIEPEWNWKPLS